MTDGIKKPIAIRSDSTPKTADEFIEMFDKDEGKEGLQILTSWKTIEMERRGPDGKIHSGEIMEFTATDFFLKLSELSEDDRQKVLARITDYKGLSKEDHISNIRYFANFDEEATLKAYHQMGSDESYLNYYRDLVKIVDSVDRKVKKETSNPKGRFYELRKLLDATPKELERLLTAMTPKQQYRAIVILQKFRPEVLFKLQFSVDMEKAFEIEAADPLNIMVMGVFDKPDDIERTVIEYLTLKLMDDNPIRECVGQSAYGGLLFLSGVAITEDPGDKDFIMLSYKDTFLPEWLKEKIRTARKLSR